MAEVSGEPFVTDAMFEGREGFGVQTVNNLILLSEKSVPKLTG